MYNYKIYASRYGAECCVGDVPNEFYNYWMNQKKFKLSDYLWEENWGDENESLLLQALPPEARLESRWWEVDNREHLCCPFLDFTKLTIVDDHEEVVFETDLYISVMNEDRIIMKNGIIIENNHIKNIPLNGTSNSSVLITTSLEKGDFLWILEDDQPFDIKHLEFYTTVIGDETYLSQLLYKGLDVEYLCSDGSICKDFQAWLND
jgi:hypothetical protein